MKRTAFFIVGLSVFCSACAIFPSLPEESAVKGFLARDAVNNLRDYEKAFYGCSSVEVVSVIHESKSPEARFRNPGNYLVSGVISERWTVSACGSEREYDVIMQGSPGGHYIAIGRASSR